MADTARKFRREQPHARRDSLVEATLRSLAAHGHDGASVRRIAAEAGVSVGLINHHYASIDELIAAAYEKVALGIVRQLLETTEAAPPSPRGFPAPGPGSGPPRARRRGVPPRSRGCR